MAGPAHKDHTKHFNELTYQEQANSINATVLNLESAITHHITHAEENAKDANDVKQKCLGQLNGMIDRIKKEPLPSTSLSV